VAAEETEQPLLFGRPVALAAQPLTRLGPAVVRPGIHLCVTRRDGELLVWGSARKLPRFCFVLEVLAPGLLVVKQSRGDESGKFVNVAVLQGDEIKVVDEHAAASPDCPELVASFLELRSESDSPDSVNVLMRLAVSIRAHGRGGSLLVVPAGTRLWEESILQPIGYAVAPPFCALAELIGMDAGERSNRRWQDAFQRAVDGIAGLTAVDGATIITDRSELLGFGAKIVRRVGCEQVSRVMVTEPIEGSVSFVAEPGQLGGTRHLSAAQFVHDQRDAIALIASQDGRFTVFGWSPCDESVYANRIETLLL
jgi:hypothetical protein